MHVTTVVASDDGMNDSFVADMMARAGKEGLVFSGWRWLRQNRALDIFYDKHVDETKFFFRTFFKEKSVDIISQHQGNRQKKAILADMESTLIQQEMLDEIAKALNAGEKIEAITAAAMQGKIDFREALHQRIRLLAGAPAVLLQDLAATMTFHTGAKTLFDTMKKNGAECWIVSGGFMYFIEKIGAQLGAHRCYGNELLMADDKVVGELLEPVLGREAKRDIYRRAQVELSISAADIVCVGDGANDLEMLMECQENNGLAVAYYAKPVVKEKISTHINHTDLTTILYAQGYVFDQFAHA